MHADSTDGADVGAGRESDHLLGDVVRRKLLALFGHRRWRVHVKSGHVVLCDRVGDAIDAHVATIIAMAIPGVRSVDALLRHSCPHH